MKNPVSSENKQKKVDFRPNICAQMKRRNALASSSLICDKIVAILFQSVVGGWESEGAAMAASFILQPSLTGMEI